MACQLLNYHSTSEQGRSGPLHRAASRRASPRINTALSRAAAKLAKDILAPTEAFKTQLKILRRSGTVAPPLRAETRISLLTFVDDAALWSWLLALDGNAKNAAYVIPTDLCARRFLGLYYQLTHPMMIAVQRIQAMAASPVSYSMLQGPLLILSIFESIRAETFLNGTRLSSISSLVWSRANASLDLGKFLLLKNAIDFSESTILDPVHWTVTLTPDAQERLDHLVARLTAGSGRGALQTMAATIASFIAGHCCCYYHTGPGGRACFPHL